MARFDLNLLSALDALLSETNVTRAAEKINVSQPTMSGMLLRLRHQFGDQLLVRVGRQLELTPLARSLTIPVREALLTVQSVMLTCPQFDPATDGRTFSVMTSDYGRIALLSRVIRRLAVEAPFIRLEIKPIAAPIDHLIEGDIDLVISTDDWNLFHRDPRADILNSEVLFTDDFVCVVDSAHPLTGKVSIEALFEYPHVAVQLEGDVTTIVEATLREHCESYRPVYTVADFMAIPYTVAGTGLIGIIQRRLAEHVSRANAVRVLEPPFHIPPTEEKLLWHARNADDPAHSWLRQCMIEEARAAAAETTTMRPPLWMPRPSSTDMASEASRHVSART
ncbi:LysR family transcriptional regulator [Sphingobium chungangianum]